MNQVPFDTSAYPPNLMPSFKGPSIQQLHHQPNMPSNKPPMLPQYSQFPPQFALPQMTYMNQPVGMPHWNNNNNSWQGSSMPPVFPAAPSVMQPGLQQKNTHFIPTTGNMTQWPPAPAFVQPVRKHSDCKPPAGSGPVQSRAFSAPPPVELSSENDSTPTAVTAATKAFESFNHACLLVKLLLDKMVPLNFDSTASRIRKLLTTERHLSHNDQFCEVVRIIVDHSVDVANQDDALAMHINLCKSLSKVEFSAGEDAKSLNFINVVVNCCFSLMHIRSAPISDNERTEKCDAEKILNCPSEDSSSKVKMIGAVKLIASLYKSKELPKGIIVDCVNRLIRLEGEDAIACIYELLRLIGRDFDDNVKVQKEKQHWWANLFETLKFIERRSVATPRMRAWIQEIIDAKESNWAFPERNSDDVFMVQLDKIMESLSINSIENVKEVFGMATKRLRLLMPTCERRPYLFTEIMHALMKRLQHYHEETYGKGKSIVDTQQLAKIQIENEVLIKQKQTSSEAIKIRDKTIHDLQEKLLHMEAINASLSRELAMKEKTIEQQLLNEANFQATAQMALEAKIEEIRKQLTIELEALALATN